MIKYKRVKQLKLAPKIWTFRKVPMPSSANKNVNMDAIYTDSYSLKKAEVPSKTSIFLEPVSAVLLVYI